MKTRNQVETVNKTKIAISYVRYSTPEQERGGSEQRQLDTDKAVCAQHGWQLSTLPPSADRGKSGFHAEHRQSGGNLKALLEAVTANHVILIENVDRWGRDNPFDSMHELRQAVLRGVEFYFKDERIHVTRESLNQMQVRCVLFFAAERANGESKRKSEMIQWRWNERKEQVRQGKPARINRMPLWLGWVGQTVVGTGHPELIEEKAAVVRQMFTWACEGKGILEIVRALADTPPLTVPKKHNAKRKAVWNPTTVRGILTNKAAIGYCTSVEPAREGVWPPVVSEDVFYRAQRKLDVQKVDKRPGHQSERNLLTGLAKCGCCGQHNLIIHWSGGHGQTADSAHNDARLVCGGAGAGRSKCGFRGVPYMLVEDSLLSLLADADLLRPLLASPEQKPSRLDELQARLADAQKLAAKLAKLIIDDDAPSPMLYQRMKQEEARAKRLASEIEQERARERSEQPALLSYNAFLASLPALAKDPARRPELRRAVRAVVESVSLDPRGQGVTSIGRGNHGHYTRRAGSWTYSVQLRGASEPVQVDVDAKGWSHRSLRPAEYVQAGQNVIG